MENNISIELPDQTKKSIPSLAIVVIIFICLVALINYTFFKEIYLVSEGRAEDFDLKSFFGYNLSIKLALYPFKFIGLVSLFMLGAFLFKVENLKLFDTLKIVILAELVKYLPEISKIIWFTYISPESLEGYELALFNDYLSINGLLGITSENMIYPLFNYISITQCLYMLAIAQLINLVIPKGLGYHFQWVLITYGISILLIGMVSIIIRL